MSTLDKTYCYHLSTGITFKTKQEVYFINPSEVLNSAHFNAVDKQSFKAKGVDLKPLNGSTLSFDGSEEFIKDFQFNQKDLIASWEE